jgi:hypothetical protein
MVLPLLRCAYWCMMTIMGPHYNSTSPAAVTMSRLDKVCLFDAGYVGQASSFVQNIDTITSKFSVCTAIDKCRCGPFYRVTGNLVL